MTGMLETRSRLDERDLRNGLSGNLCRCTGYNKIVEAIQYAADKMANPETEEAQA